jgi:hypothetical protein
MQNNSHTSLSSFDKFFLLTLIVMVSIGWVFIVFNPIPTPDFGYYFIIYGPPGWMITTWLLCVWGLIIYNLFDKKPATLYRVEDDYALLLKEAYKEIDEFLKETT